MTIATNQRYDHLLDYLKSNQAVECPKTVAEKLLDDIKVSVVIVYPLTPTGFIAMILDRKLWKEFHRSDFEIKVAYHNYSRIIRKKKSLAYLLEKNRKIQADFRYFIMNSKIAHSLKIDETPKDTRFA